ncbi:DNA primase [Helicobacter bilis]|nr:DNA primase [Helicobacter bilis]
MIENIDELKEQINIVDIISHYLPLKKNGSNYTACCPFHTEDTASFMVSPTKQIYHCFGCLVGGDAIKFVMQLQKIDYIEAIKEIANIIGFKLIYKNGKLDSLMQDNEIFLDYALSNQQHIMQIALNRGISEAVIKEFCIGYGGEDFEIRNLSENKKEALQSGILFESNNGYKSMFSKRLIIPIFDANGKCVAFSGRSLDSKQNPKYINSKQTKLYNKSKILFGYDKAKKHIAKEKSVYIVEGYFDVLALHTMGFKNSVGICGTAFTKEHIALLTKYDDISINLALDNDSAGMSATLRAINILIQYELYNSFSKPLH